MTHLQVIRGGEVLGMGIADYIWLDDDGDLSWKKKTILITKDDLGAKTPVLDRWSFFDDDSGKTSIVVPCHFLPDPTRPQPNFIVLCEVRDDQDIPVDTEYRAKLRKKIAALGSQGTLAWFGFEQDYTVEDSGSKDEPNFEQRKMAVAERHFGACFDAGLMLHSMCGYPGCSPWDFKVGVRDFPQDIDPDPPNALVVADHLIIARYLMHKIAGDSGLYPEWQGIRPFISTAALREPGADVDYVAMNLETSLDDIANGFRRVPHPTRGGVVCLEVEYEDSANPYQLALDMLRAVWPEPPME